MGANSRNIRGWGNFLVNVSISRRWYCKLAIFSDWDKASYLVGISKIFDSRKIVFLRFEFILPFPEPSVDWTFFFGMKTIHLRIQFFHVNVSKTRKILYSPIKLFYSICWKLEFFFLYLVDPVWNSSLYEIRGFDHHKRNEKPAMIYDFFHQ